MGGGTVGGSDGGSGRGDGGLSIAEGEMEGGGKGVKECERWESARV